MSANAFRCVQLHGGIGRIDVAHDHIHSQNLLSQEKTETSPPSTECDKVYKDEEFKEKTPGKGQKHTVR
jgi:hypothetical protein